MPTEIKSITEYTSIQSVNQFPPFVIHAKEGIQKCKALRGFWIPG